MNLIIKPEFKGIGGVSVHLNRLEFYLKKNYINYKMISYKHFYRYLIQKKQIKSLHLHLTNIYLIFIFYYTFRFFNFNNIFITFHFELLRLNKRQLALLSYFLSNKFTPLVLNQSSFDFSIKFNKRTKLVSAFLPPLQHEYEIEDLQKLVLLKKISKFKHVFCTNAYAPNFDNNGIEVYGIIDLINIFKNLDSSLLIISDSNGKYKEFLNKKCITYSNNIHFINKPHNFSAIIKLSDCFIRYTSTDGDSLSIWEAIFLNKLIITTNVVTRPEYNNLLLIPRSDIQLLDAINSIINKKLSINKNNFNFNLAKALKQYQ